jgi:branched-chain amino acid transport system substrate-binding protein
MKIAKVLLVLLIFAITVAVSPVLAADTIKVGAILAVTGPASFLGAPESKTLEMLADEINAKGGINGKNIELIIKDSGASPEKAISFAKQLIEEEKVLAIIGPSTSGETMKIKNIMEEAKAILLSCAAAEVIVNPVAKYRCQKNFHADAENGHKENRHCRRQYGIRQGWQGPARKNCA